MTLVIFENWSDGANLQLLKRLDGRAWVKRDDDPPSVRSHPRHGVRCHPAPRRAPWWSRRTARRVESQGASAITPGPLVAQAAAFDTRRQRVVLSGAFRPREVATDALWEWGPDGWTERRP